MDEDTVTIPVDLLEQLIDVCRWHKSACSLSRLGETYDNCPDQNSFDYLENEAESIKQQAEQYLPKKVEEQ